jgi:hypothetical protein
VARRVRALQAVDCHNNLWPLKNLNQPVKDALIIVRPWLQILFKDALRVAHRLQRNLLIGH